MIKYKRKRKIPGCTKGYQNVYTPITALFGSFGSRHPEKEVYTDVYMSDFMKTGSALFSALCAKLAVNVFFLPETISKVDDIKSKGNVIFFLSLLL